MKLNRLSSLSAYARPESHLTRQTFHGAAGEIMGNFPVYVSLIIPCLHSLFWIHALIQLQPYSDVMQINHLLNEKCMICVGIQTRARSV